MSNYPSKDNTSREMLVKNATQGGFAIGGGVALMIVHGIAGIPVVGAVVGVAMLLGGLMTRGKGKSKDDQLSSLALIGLGAVSTLSALTFIPVLSSLASGLMTVSAIGLIGFGAYKLWQYFKGMKARG